MAGLSLKSRPQRAFIDVRSLDEHASLIIAPNGALFQVDLDAASCAALFALCDGQHSVADILGNYAAPEAISEILATLTEAGCLTIDEPVHHSKTIYVIGDHELFDICRDYSLFPSGSEQKFFSDNLEIVEHDSHSVDLVIVMNSYFDWFLLTNVDKCCEHHSIPWTPLYFDQGRAFIGPLIVPGRTAHYRDLLIRRRCASDDEKIFQALISQPALKPSLPSDRAILWVLSRFWSEVEHWLRTEHCQLLSVEWELDPYQFASKAHPVLPLPDHQLTGAFLCSLPVTPRLLVDERLGIILRYREVEHHPSVPKRLKTVQTHCANMARAFEWANDVICGGSAFDDSEAALLAAVGEAVERYCGNYIGQLELTHSSYNDLIDRGEYAVDPERLVLYSPKMYQTPGCPFVPFTRDLSVRWVRGFSLTKNCPAWLPLSLVCVNYLSGEFKNDPVTNYLQFSGIAAGATIEAALVSAIEELIERDATTVWWMNRHPLPSLKLPAFLEALWEGAPRQAGQRAWLIYIENEFDIPVIAGVLENTNEHYLNIGFAARPDPVSAGLKAWTEALTLQEGSRDLALADSLIRQAMEWGLTAYVDLKPWRADRRYLDDYRADFRDVSDLMCQQQIFLDPRAIEAVRPWVETPATRPMESVPCLSDRTLATYQGRIESRGFEIFFVELTTPDVALTGLRVVRVLIPGLAPNFPAAFPTVGGGRIQQTAVRLGWRTTPLAEDELNYWPIPHA